MKNIGSTPSLISPQIPQFKILQQIQTRVAILASFETHHVFLILPPLFFLWKNSVWQTDLIFEVLGLNTMGNIYKFLYLSLDLG